MSILNHLDQKHILELEQVTTELRHFKPSTKESIVLKSFSAYRVGGAIGAASVSTPSILGALGGKFFAKNKQAQMERIEKISKK